MKYICEQCRNNVTDSQIFCDNCGSQLEQINDRSGEKTSKVYFSISGTSLEEVKRMAEKQGVDLGYNVNLNIVEFYDTVFDNFVKTLLDKKEVVDVFDTQRAMTERSDDVSNVLNGYMEVEVGSDLYNMAVEADKKDKVLNLDENLFNNIVNYSDLYSGLSEKFDYLREYVNFEIIFRDLGII